jgi:hypothetical protein
MIAIVTPAWQALTEPEIDIGHGANLPFAAPITVTNKSFLFEMRDAYLSCEFKAITWNGPVQMHGDFSIEFVANKIAIAPGKPRNFQCPMTNLPSADLISGDIFIRVKYHTLWKARVSDATQIVWFRGSTPPQWIKGGFAGPPAQ